MFIGRIDAEAEAPVLWLPDAKKWLIWKDPDAGKDWRWEEKGMTEDEMVGWYHKPMDMSLSKPWELVMDRGSFMCCNPAESETTERLNWTVLRFCSTTSAVDLWVGFLISDNPSPFIFKRGNNSIYLIKLGGFSKILHVKQLPLCLSQRAQ